MADVRVTALAPGDGNPVAQLWRELWELHETWGGYPAAREPQVYAELAQRIEGWAHDAMGDPVRGSHIHLIARDRELRAVGQIEGWIEHPSSALGLSICELRSLIVAPRMRGRGAGALLVATLESLALQIARQPVFMVAEVLHQNPWRGFYTRLDYRPFSEQLMLEAHAQRRGPSTARVATSTDTWHIARLELERRRVLIGRGDRRLDPPCALDATFLDATARSLSRPHPELTPLLAQVGDELAQAALWVSSLESPFATNTRAVLLRLWPQGSAASSALIEYAREQAALRGARRLELHDIAVERQRPARTEAAPSPHATRYSQLMARLLTPRRPRLI